MHDVECFLWAIFQFIIPIVTFVLILVQSIHCAIVLSKLNTFDKDIIVAENNRKNKKQ